MAVSAFYLRTETASVREMTQATTSRDSCAFKRRI
jgi:hypothetical protein